MVEARAGATYQVEPDFAARQAILWAIAWVVGASALAFVTSVLLVFPDLSGDLGFLSYGRLRGVADTTLWFGWLACAGFAAVYTILPRTTEVQLHNEALGATTTLTWSLLLTGGIATLLYGSSQGRPLGELPVGVDVGLTLMLVIVLYNAGVTVVRRRERTLYVSGWYLLAGALAAPIVFVVGNLPFFDGVTDAIVSGFYQNGVEVLWLLPLGLAAVHYVVPVETGRPLYSSAMARAGFWSLMFAGGWAGQRYFLKGPAPDYLDSIAFAMTVVLLVPVLSSVTNLVATGRGRWQLLAGAFGLRWAAAGLGLASAWIGLAALGAVPWVSRYVGLTAYSTAVRHLLGWGALSAFAFALVHHAYPLMVGRDWYSRRLLSFHFWATLAGVAAGTIALLGASAAQTTALLATDATGFARGVGGASIEVQRLFHGAGAGAAAVVLAAQLALAYNTFRTSRSGPLVRLDTSAGITAGSRT